MAHCWYALHCNSRKENLVAHQLVAHELDIYYPTIKVNPVNPRARKIQPYFPGYLFVRVDIETFGVAFFRYLPFVINIVSFGGVPTPVPTELLVAVDEQLEQLNLAGGEIFSRLQPGDHVVVQGTSFDGYEAIFDARINSASDRVRVLIKLLGDRLVPLELSVGHLRPLTSSLH